jgi:beta-galactosidase
LLDQARRLTRGYKEALQIGEELKTIGERLEGTVPQPQVAILQDYDNRWVLQLQPHNQQLVGPDGWQIFFLAPYEALYRRNVSTVFIHPEADLSPYKLVVAPFLNLVTEEAFANLSAYVERGGILMLGPRAGFKDEYNRVFAAPPPGPLRQLAGVTVEEFDSLPPQSTNTIRFIAEELAGREVLVRIWCEVVVPSTARVVAHYIQDYYSGRAAVTVNQFGAGRVVYLGVVGGEELYDTLLDWLLPQAGVTPLLDTPPGVEVTVREGLDRQLLFILNHTQEAQEVTLEHPYRNLIGEVIVEGSVWIPARDVLVLESPTDLGGISVFQVQE